MATKTKKPPRNGGKGAPEPISAAGDNLRKPAADGQVMLNVQVPADLRYRLKVAVAEDGTQISTVLRDLIERWLQDRKR